MKIYGKEIPADLEFPELDKQTKSEIDALHAQMLRDEEKRAEFRERHRDWCSKSLTLEEAWQHMHPGAGPRPAPSVNVEVLRKFSPRLRAIFAYIYRQEITY
ncbi:MULTISPECIES: hypothetical protein [unclassified Duganella]|uniref:hypothetical protein n=1 Tax=unclassified Duganella TaxID=2636909 RepID=UPI000E34A949|nr:MULTISPECIES: hypothetical protein [unclassified Duganella]RFP10102.1 hypothetical protein D0T23_24225 [Duganella sp. BJB475]RFP25592.1 hypothetical protein D0T21_26385 [Duganella sp. BJB476]